MTFDQTLPITTEALFMPIPNSLSSKNNTFMYVTIGLGTCLAFYGAYKLGQHLAERNSRLIFGDMEAEITRLKSEKTQKA